MRSPLVALVLATIAMSGCDDRREDDVRRAHSAYLNAWIEHDAKRFCTHLTPDVRRRIAESGHTCAARVAGLLDKYGPRRNAHYPPIGHVRISGDTARLRYAIKGGPPITLRRVDGAWLITAAPELSNEPLEGMPTF